MADLTDVIFGLTLRSYQEDLINVFEERLREGDKTFHFLAPPGSGKTIMGLEMVRRLGRQAVIFSPNSAIQGQWVRKLKSLTDDLSISTNPDDDAEILSLTYQSVSVKDRATGELHKNATQILEGLRRRGTLVLDECHHLTSHWADVIASLVDDKTYVVGLTATPPIHREAAAINRYLSLLKQIDYQIQMPAIIREGYLAPFQDLVYITDAEGDELVTLRASSETFSALIDSLEKPSLKIPSLKGWAYSRLEDFRDKKGSPIPFDELFYAQPDLCIALARYARSRMGDLPLSVIIVDEMEVPPTFADMLLVLWDYGNYVLADSAPPLFGEMRQVMLDLGYSLTPYGFQAQKRRGQILGLSGSKIGGMLAILAREIEIMGEDLRCLVLTDFEGDHISTGSTAVHALGALTKDEITDELDPILVTGKTVLVDDDLLPRFLHAAAVFFAALGLKVALEKTQIGGYFEVKGVGAGWNTRNYVHLITHLLETGVTRCLVGTRALLGEGWDSIKLNTLVDLTQVTTYVSVNQIRGRSLRHDPENLLKAVNNWDVVTIADDPQRGFVDLDRFLEKHVQFYGLSEDNVIEKGVGHVHPAFTNTGQAEIWLNRNEINAFMLKRCEERLELHTRWDVGKPYKNAETVSIDFVPVQEVRQQVSSIKGKLVQACTVNVRRINLRIGLLCGTAFLPILAAMMAAGPFGVHPIVPTAGIVLLLYLASASVATVRSVGKFGRNAGYSEDVEENLTAIGRAVLFGLQKLSILSEDVKPEDIMVKRRQGGSFRVYLEGDTENVFAASVGELFAPVQSQRYIIERQELIPPTHLLGWFSKKLSYRHVAWYPVPSAMGDKRRSADIFHRFWEQEVSPGRMFYSKRGEGLHYLKQSYRKKAFPISRRTKQIWL